MENKQGYLFEDSDSEHLHTLGGKPLTGTSTVLDVLSKPLTWWAVGEGLKTLGWTPLTATQNGKRVYLPKGPRLNAATGHLEALQGIPPEAYLAKLDAAYYAHSKSKDKAAAGGKDMHSMLEDYVKACISHNGGVPMPQKGGEEYNKVIAFANWAIENIEVFIGSEVNTYSEKYWLGGIVDCIAKLKNGKVAIIDFKSSKAAYPAHFFQIGGYDIQLSEMGGYTPKGEKILEPVQAECHIIIPFGAPEFAPALAYDEKGLHREAFLAALTLHRTIQKIEA